MNYDHKKIEEKWENVWEERGINSVDLVGAKHPFYNLMMFPYPSAEGLHVGNMYAFTGADVYGRFMKMRGFDVFEPIGLDGFGIHSENYAIKVNKHPLEQAKISQERFYKQLRRIGNIFDWKHTVETYDPDYYKWTQWTFLKLFKAGLVERKKAPVNFCPSCLTVLADEQVIAGECERCGSKVEKKDLEQWFFKITNYAERLLKNLETIDWSEKVKTAQRLWIGRKEGAVIQFSIFNFQFSIKSQLQNFQTDKIEVFTTRPDTLFGATFMVMSPEHELVSAIDNEEVKKYVEEAKKKSNEERISEKRKKTGVFTGLCAVNPANNEKIPVWVADYVLKEYGTGAIMGVPGGDERDLEFAKQFNLPIIYDYPEYTGEVKKVTTYHLRDWLVSRQRYWGAPIPMIRCEKCAKKGIAYKNSKFQVPNSNEIINSNFQNQDSVMAGWFPVPEDELPVLLPKVENWRPTGTGRGPLAGVDDFVHTKCPKCGSDADRETDVFDTFLDSSWYFLRYPSVGKSDDQKTQKTQRIRLSEDSENSENQKVRNSDLSENLNIRSSEYSEFSGYPNTKNLPWDPEITRKWLPVNIYIGGAEHSVLHLMYSRFVTMALHDLGYLDFEEPFTKFYAHGLIIKEGAKMSKSRGNIVNPDEYIEKFGADALRTYLMFIGPFSEGGDFRNFGVAGVSRFLSRVFRWVSSQLPITNDQLPKSDNTHRKLQKLIKDVTEDLEKLRYNTAIAKCMEFLNWAAKNECDNETVKTYLKLLAPFAPHLTDELYSKFGGSKSIHQDGWPKFDEKAIVEEEVTIVVQVNGKVRDKLPITNYQLPNEEEIIKIASERERVKKYLEGGVKKTIFVPGKLVNFVV